jgi:hypothetical protein
MTEAYEASGELPAETPIFSGDGVALFTDTRNAAVIGEHDTLPTYLLAHLRRVVEDDYVALLAYVDMNEANHRILRRIRGALRRATRAATCLGFGPRFLHSTGQAYKGGPPSGVFLQITSDDAEDVPIPGRTLSFGVVKAAQARGDFAVLAQRGRRALRVHLGADVERGLQTLLDAIDGGK